MRSDYFEIHELVPKHIFETHNINAWRFIRPELIQAIDAIKKKFNNGTMTINNYYWGGQYHWSGLRTPKSSNYSETSMHSLGCAADCKFSNYDVSYVRKYIIDHPEEFPTIRGIELDVAWLHIDTRNTDKMYAFKG